MGIGASLASQPSGSVGEDARSRVRQRECQHLTPELAGWSSRTRDRGVCDADGGLALPEVVDGDGVEGEAGQQGRRALRRPSAKGKRVPNDVKYDKHYRDDPAACGTPFAEFEAGSVLDLGCGQGRDALRFARAGHRALGVDVSSVGINQMREVAEAEGLGVEGVVADICTYEPDQRSDVVILDRVLHMLTAEDRIPMLETATGAVAPGSHLLVAEGPKGMTPVREAVEESGWVLVKARSNRLIARRPDA